MSNFNKLNKDVPDSLSPEILVDVVGDVTKKRFVGSFQCRIPRKKEQCLIDKHRAFLNGPSPEQLDPDTLRFHHMIAYLRFTIDGANSPKWWRDNDLGYELYDENVVKNLYDQVLDFEVKWLTEIWGEEEIAKRQGKVEEPNGKPAEKEGA